MASLLYRFGRLSFRQRRYFALLWVAILAACSFAALSAPAAEEDGFSIPGTESQKAFDLLDERFPGDNAEGADARIVFAAPDGQKVTARANRAAVEKVVDTVARGTQVKDASSPFAPEAVSKDASTAFATVTYSASSDDLSEATTNGLMDAVEDGRAAGLTVEVGGSAVDGGPELGGITELIGIAVAALVLFITFRAMVAAGLPLVTALIGLGAGVCAIVAVGMSTTTITLALMLGLAVGIDYALFIVSRYRAERAEGQGPEEAAGRAVGTAGSAVVFAGATVVIALVGLSVAGVPMLTDMGLAAAGTVVIAVLVALTLLPALLGFFPQAVLPRAQRRTPTTPTTVLAPGRGKEPAGSRWARLVIRRPLATLLLSVAGLGIVAVPALDLQLSLPGDEAQPTSTTQRRAYDALADGFGPGFNGPLTVVVDAKDADDAKDAAARARTALSATKGIVEVSPATFNKVGDTAIIAAVPSTGPAASATKDLVKTIRAQAPGLKADAGASMWVTGQTAMNIDVSNKVTAALIPYLAVVVGLAVLLLMVVFRSVLVPLKAALGFLLSVVASFGVIVAVFQWGWLADLLGVAQTGPVMSMMPIFLIGVVFGLAMDYEVFLVTRIREAYVHGASPAQAIVTGFRHSARVVVAAAVIMIAVFAGFIGMTDSMIKMLGLGLAAAVLFDAFVVRMTIVPAALALLGKAAWRLPRWLDRILPDLDIEGEKLTRTLAAEPTTARAASAREESVNV
ncbi:MMPL family transporter [Streptomyces flavofungini]|uniref:MMPL family transporter n=1 Tax=Streptomyces flavofungini TaxID=68200 RepID=A0ABS0XIQ3_9ACTN|nr:MMPL family transporter [Streptomyces flavofungini]MBJ3813103.1 MMPL family transporter [Streptomyces flavofungini]GHC89594.1 membrane protein [Streptomyces flavofungini]